MFDMLDATLTYQAAIDEITNKHKLRVSEYTLDSHEWELLQQLHDVLKIYTCHIAFFPTLTHYPHIQILKDATLFFFTLNTQFAYGCPCHRLYRQDVCNQHLEEGRTFLSHLCCHQPCKTNAQSLLLTYRLIQAILYCNGYMLSQVSFYYL